MKNKVEYSQRALQDLDEIWNYIKNNLHNPTAAANTVNGIMDKIDYLSDFPEAGARLEFDNALDSGYRYVSFKRYIAFYRIGYESIVYIDRVIYSGRDYAKILSTE